MIRPLFLPALFPLMRRAFAPANPESRFPTPGLLP
jgi:hypothetical protein